MAPGNRPDLDRLTTAVDALGTAFADVATETLTPDTLSAASTLANRAANMIDGFRADLARTARDLRPAGTPAPGSTRTLDPNGHRPRQQPERDSARADLFDEYTELGDATRRGELPGDYADAINTAITRLTATERAAFTGRHREHLTKQALRTGLHEFRVHVRHLVDEFSRAGELERARRQHRNRCGRLWDDTGDGMTKLFAAFDPETGARIRQAVDEEIARIYRTKRDDPDDTRTHQQIVADAIANLILTARTSGTSRTELVVLVDLETLIADNHQPADGSTTATREPGRANAGAGTTDADPTPADADTDTDADADADVGRAGRCCETSDGTPLPVETVRRLACHADILPAVLNGDGVVLDLGRAQRLASTAQRQALRVMYPHCAFHGCTIPFDRCEIHHIDPYGPPTNGETNIDKLVPTCQRHHHHIHDHDLRLSLDPDNRTLTVTHPDGGEELHPLPTRRRRRSNSPPDEMPRPA